MTMREDRLHRGGRRPHVGKTGRKHRARRRPRQQTQRGFGHDPEHPFRSGEQPDQIETGLVLVRPPADARHRAVGQHHLEPENVMARHPVFQAARTARIGRDVPADAAVFEAGRIGRIKKSLAPRRLLQMPGDHPRLDHRDEILRAHFLDAVHARGREHDPAAHRHASADITVSRPAGGHGNFLPGRDLHHAGGGRRRSRENHGFRRIPGEPLVPRRRGEGSIVGPHAVDAGDPAQLVDDPRVHALTSP